MNSVLLGDDELYEDLYDVRREAEEIGNLVEEDINPAMSALRDKAPVQKGFLRDLLGAPGQHRHTYGVAGREGYTCFSFETCNEAFRDHERFSSRVYHHGPDEEQRLGILEMDQPQHLSFRGTLQPLFLKPRVATWWRSRFIDEIVYTLVENLKVRDRAELNLQLCARVPVHTITRAIGMDGDDALVFRTALMKSGAHARLSMEEIREASATVERMLFELIAKRRSVPGDDLVTHLVQAEMELADGTKRPLTDREIMINIRLVMLAGGGTSWRQFGITLFGLLTNPEQLAAVKAERNLIDRAIEESLRWNATDPVFSRIVVEDTELGGVHLPAGSVLDICLGAANHDPTRWDNPAVYDLHRPTKGHLGFGVGHHMCLGRDVGRTEIAVGLNALFDTFPNIRLDPDAEAPFLTGGLEQRGMSSVPVLLR